MTTITIAETSTTLTVGDGSGAAAQIATHNASASAHSDIRALISGQDTLAEMTDVTISAVGSGEVLAHNGSNWLNQTLAEAGIEADLGNPASNGYVLSSTTGGTRSWVAASAASLDGLTDTTITANSAGEVLKWSGSAWINNTLAEAGISATGHEHATTDITSGTFADALVAASNVTQHQAALSITELQISDLGTTAAMVADNLSVFAATTSAQLAGVISDKTGTDSLVFSASPTFTGTVNLAAAIASGSVVSPVFAPASDSTTAVKITKADKTTAVLTVDTTNGVLYLNGVTLANNSGTSNTFIGSGAGGGTHTGTHGTALGVNAMGGSSSGIQSTAFGSSALWVNTGNFTTGVGYQSGYTNTGADSTFIGWRRGYGNTTANRIEIGNRHGALIEGTRATTAALSTLVLNADDIQIGADLPTSDPGVARQLWNDAGTVKISAG